MARADLLLSLIKAATRNDQALVRKTVEAMVAEERSKRHTVLAEQLEQQLHLNGNGTKTELVPARLPIALDLVQEITPRKTLSDIILSSTLRNAVDELVEEHHRSDLLRSYNLKPRNRILLTGAPGNGKTSLAEALAHSLMVPLVVVRYEGLITSYLGETATRLRRLFEFAHTRRCVLFFDEFDTLGKERGDIHETGEIKRVVSSLLLQIDDLPAHAVVISATNHPELLDRAVWRRFQLRLELPRPTREQIKQYFDQSACRLNFEFGLSHRTLAGKLVGANFSELEDFTCDVARAYVLALPGGDARAITTRKLQQWTARPATNERRTRK
jgi:SpoVK/Ycf46/Vps4 family AAA+-type ATPase